MTENFQVWIASYQMERGFAALTKLMGFKKTWLLNKGVPLVDQWPELVTLSMNPRYPKATQLMDIHFSDPHVVSKRAKEILTPLAGESRIEFLPVSVLNHKDRLVSKDYFILNPLNVIDCIDVKKSGVVWNAIDPTCISNCNGLVLKEDAIPKTVNLLRPKFWTHVILVRRAMAEKLSAEQLTGLSFLDSSEFTG